MVVSSEEERIAALATYDVLDTSAEAAFDELTRLAAQICEVPIAMVSLVDRERQWFKSCVGLDSGETPRDIAFCAHAIRRDEPFVVPDAERDPVFATNPLVTGPPHVRFYAGIPLVDDDGAALGTLCVIDTAPRVLSETQMSALGVLAKQVMAQLQLRRANARLAVQLGAQEDASRARDIAQAAELSRARALREMVDRAHHRAAFLADAGKLLAASLDTDRTLDAVAHMSVPRFADLCSIMVRDDEHGRRLRRVADAGLYPDAALEMQALRQNAELDASVAMQEAIEHGGPVLFADYVGWLAERLPQGNPYLVTVQRLDVVSAISAPMMVAGQVVGVLSVAVQRVSGRAYCQDDAFTLGELAQRAAVALENARLFGEAQRERARAEAASRTKDLFLAAVSHDLRTPLNAIMGWAQMLRNKSSDEVLRARGLEVIERSARSQSRLIEDLLDVSRIVSGQLIVEREAIDLVGVVEAAVDALRPTAASRRIELAVALDPSARNGTGDSGRLEQVVWNIITNAIKFSEPGGRVEIRLERLGAEAELTVRDQGLGIEPDLLPKIFEPFRQDEAGVGRRLGGLGLGLAIAKHIVETLGGAIAAESDGAGQGARFVVRLPLSSGADDQVDAPAQVAQER
jgi:signal transduction histidine kinase